MKEISNVLKSEGNAYPYEKLGSKEEILFFDIETTGFTANTSDLYLIGCAYFENGVFNTLQWFAENADEQEAIIYEFFTFASRFKKLIHFNGNKFDIPYVEEKCKQLGLDFDFFRFEGVDIFKRLHPYKSFLKLSSLKQTAIEELIGFDRHDEYDGGKLVSVYKDYLAEPTDDKLTLLFNHNLEDLRGMISIVPILAIVDIFNEPIKVLKAGRSPYTDMQGNQCSEIIMELQLPTALPVPISYGYADCYFKAEGSVGKLRVSLYEGELKFFYPNYKEYHYIPSEDMAVHKSVSGFMDPSQREQAKASNCYAKKTGLFLPEWNNLFEPVFRMNYNDRTMYFELTNEIKRDALAFNKYAAHLLEYMAHPEL